MAEDQTEWSVTMSCRDFTSTSPSCRSFTIIEPEGTLLTAVSSGGIDQSLDESGSVVIPPFPPANLRVSFQTRKASTNYRFEYLYIDTPGISLPGAVQPVVTDSDVNGFTVEFAGLPLEEGYILRWRVVVVGLLNNVTPGLPESLRLQIPRGVRVFTATFTSARTSITYGFSELRVENLIDAVDDQRIVQVQVVSKSESNFTVGVNPPPDTDNYFLVARTS